MSCRPSSASGALRLISTMTILACCAKLAEFPTDMVGMMPPSAVMAIASITAMSTGARSPERSCSAVSDRCWSMNITSPLLILRRSAESLWNGRRRHHAGVGHQAVAVVAERGAGDQGQVQRLVARAFDQRQRHRLGVAGARENAHADRHAIAEQARGLLRRHQFFHQRGAPDPVFIHVVLQSL